MKLIPHKNSNFYLYTIYKYYILLIIKLENYGFKNFNSMNFYVISEYI